MTMKTVPRLPSIALTAGLAGAFLTISAIAQSATSVSDEDLLLAGNPIIIKNRVRISNEFTDVGGGGSRDKIIVGGTYGFGFNGHDRNFALGFELPILENHPAGGHSAWGVGDLKLRTGQLFVDDPAGWRAGWFGEAEFDTAADQVRAIGNQRTQMAFGGGASHPVWSIFTLTSTVQYGWSLDNGETTGRKAEWEGHLTLSAKVSECVSLNLDYKAVVNTVGETTLHNTLEPSVGWTLGEKKNLGLFASLEWPLDETGTNWVAKAGAVWFF